MTRSQVEVHVVDNASSDESEAMVLDEFPDVVLFSNDENVGFARASNRSWYLARGRYWMLLNSDTEVQTGALDALLAFMDTHPKAGLATARLVNPDGTPQYCAQPVPGILRTLLEVSRLHKLFPHSLRNQILLSRYWSYDQAARVGWTWGTALIARREAVEDVGPLCEDFFMYGEDLEWCLRMRRHGLEVWFCPDAEVLHHGGQSSLQHWNDIDRGSKIWDGFYKALERHRSRFYVRALQATMIIALGIEWLASKLRGRDSAQRLSASLAYHLRSLTGAG